MMSSMNFKEVKMIDSRYCPLCKCYPGASVKHDPDCVFLAMIQSIRKSCRQGASNNANDEVKAMNDVLDFVSATTSKPQETSGVIPTLPRA